MTRTGTSRTQTTVLTIHTAYALSGILGRIYDKRVLQALLMYVLEGIPDGSAGRYTAEAHCRQVHAGSILGGYIPKCSPLGSPKMYYHRMYLAGYTGSP